MDTDLISGHPGPRILVIDDRRDVAAMIAELCEALGTSAAISREGESVRAMLNRASPLGVIVDVMMPEEDGYEALGEIAQFDPQMPVMLITGHGEAWLRVGAALGRAHGLEHIETAIKPVRAETLQRFLDVVRGRSVPLPHHPWPLLSGSHRAPAP